MNLIREILTEKRMMMEKKGNECPSISWQERYDFLERYSHHLRNKLSVMKDFALDDIFNQKRDARLEKEEEKREEEKKQNAWKKMIGR